MKDDKLCIGHLVYAKTKANVNSKIYLINSNQLEVHTFHKHPEQSCCFHLLAELLATYTWSRF